MTNDTHTPTPRPPEQPTRALVSQKGIATLVAMAAAAMLGVLTLEMSTDATVEYEAAKNIEKDMKAHFLARSGMNLAEIVIKVQTDILDRYRQYIGDVQLADYLPMFVGAFGGSKDEVAALGALVAVDTAAIKGLGLEEGEFDIRVATDDGKVNINCANGAQTSRDALGTQLAAMFFPVAYDEIFQQENADGYRRDRETQAAAFIDYVDRDNAKFGVDGTPEDYGYENGRDKYLPKNNYIDSVQELRLVRGVDDRFWTLFGSAFTVYGSCKQNVGAIQDINVIASIIYVSRKAADDKVANDPIKLWALAQYVAQARNLGMYFDKIDTFADFVKDPGAALGDLLGGAEGGGAAGAVAGAIQFPEGVELDRAKLGQVATAGPRRTYRVEVTSAVGREQSGARIQKRITGVWDTTVQRQNVREGQGTKGAWVYWREE